MTIIVSIHDAIFRASTYFGSADSSIRGDWDGPPIVTLWDKQTESFNQATARFPMSGYQNNDCTRTNSECSSYSSPQDDDMSVIKRATIVMGGAMVARRKGMYHQLGVAAVARG